MDSRLVDFRKYSTFSPVLSLLDPAWVSNLIGLCLVPFSRKSKYCLVSTDQQTPACSSTMRHR